MAAFENILFTRTPQTLDAPLSAVRVKRILLALIGACYMGYAAKSMKNQDLPFRHF